MFINLPKFRRPNDIVKWMLGVQYMEVIPVTQQQKEKFKCDNNLFYNSVFGLDWEN